MVVIVTSVPGRSFDIIDLKKEKKQHPRNKKKNIKPFCRASFWIDGLPSSQTIFENRCGWRKYRMRHSSRSGIQGFLEKLHLLSVERVVAGDRLAKVWNGKMYQINNHILSDV